MATTEGVLHAGYLSLSRRAGAFRRHWAVLEDGGEGRGGKRLLLVYRSARDRSDGVRALWTCALQEELEAVDGCPGDTFGFVLHLVQGSRRRRREEGAGEEQEQEGEEAERQVRMRADTADDKAGWLRELERFLQEKRLSQVTAEEQHQGQRGAAVATIHRMLLPHEQESDTARGGAGDEEPVLVVWRLEGQELQRDEEACGGHFASDQTYLVYVMAFVDASCERHVHYWIGTDAPPDLAMVASIKAVELRRGFAFAVPARAADTFAIHREDQDEETPEFLARFGGSIFVRKPEKPAGEQGKGQKRNAFLHRVRRTRFPTLYRVTATPWFPGSSSIGSRDPQHERELYGRAASVISKFFTYRLPFRADERVSDRVLLVDDGFQVVYLWLGSLASFVLRGLGLESATRLAAESPKGARVVQVLEDEEPEDFLKLFEQVEDLQDRQDARASATASPDPLDRSMYLFEGSRRVLYSVREVSSTGEADEEGSKGLVLALSNVQGSSSSSSHHRRPHRHSQHGQRGTQLQTQARAHVQSPDQESEQDESRLDFVIVAKTPFEDGTDVAGVIPSKLLPEDMLGDMCSPRLALYDDSAPPTLQNLPAPALAMLLESEAFILDCWTELFVWVGPRASRASRLVAHKLAQVLQTAVLRPNWVTTSKQRPGHESILFRTKFLDWAAGTRVAQAARPSTFFAAVRTITDMNAAEKVHSDDDKAKQQEQQEQEGGNPAATALFRDLVEAFSLPGPEEEEEDDDDDDEGDGEGGKRVDDDDAGFFIVDDYRFEHHLSDTDEEAERVQHLGVAHNDGFGELLVWRISRGRLVSLPEEEMGHFHAEYTYVQLFGFDAKEEEAAADGDRDAGEGEDDSAGAGRNDDGADGTGGKQGRGSRQQEDFRARLSRGVMSGEVDAVRFVLFVWRGRCAPSRDMLEWQFTLKEKTLTEWSAIVGAKEIPHYVVAQGHEPSFWLQIFAPSRGHGRYIVHDPMYRDRSEPSQRVLLFRVSQVKDVVVSTQVPPRVNSLCSEHVFVCMRVVLDADAVHDLDEDDYALAGLRDVDIYRETVWFWVGAYSSLRCQEQGATMAMRLIEHYGLPSGLNVDVIEENRVYEHKEDDEDGGEGDNNEDEDDVRNEHGDDDDNEDDADDGDDRSRGRITPNQLQKRHKLSASVGEGEHAQRWADLRLALGWRPRDKRRRGRKDGGAGGDDDQFCSDDEDGNDNELAEDEKYFAAVRDAVRSGVGTPDVLAVANEDRYFCSRFPSPRNMSDLPDPSTVPPAVVLKLQPSHERFALVRQTRYTQRDLVDANVAVVLSTAPVPVFFVWRSARCSTAHFQDVLQAMYSFVEMLNTGRCSTSSAILHGGSSLAAGRDFPSFLAEFQVSIKVVTQSLESLEFTSLFPGWDYWDQGGRLPSGDRVRDLEWDPRAEHLQQLEQEGKLGDMKSLVGRVMTRAEAGRFDTDQADLLTGAVESIMPAHDRESILARTGVGGATGATQGDSAHSVTEDYAIRIALRRGEVGAVDLQARAIAKREEERKRRRAGSVGNGRTGVPGPSADVAGAGGLMDASHASTTVERISMHCGKTALVTEEDALRVSMVMAEADRSRMMQENTFGQAVLSSADAQDDIRESEIAASRGVVLKINPGGEPAQEPEPEPESALESESGSDSGSEAVSETSAASEAGLGTGSESGSEPGSGTASKLATSPILGSDKDDSERASSQGGAESRLSSPFRDATRAETLRSTAGGADGHAGADDGTDPPLLLEADVDGGGDGDSGRSAAVRVETNNAEAALTDAQATSASDMVWSQLDKLRNLPEEYVHALCDLMEDWDAEATAKQQADAMRKEKKRRDAIARLAGGAQGGPRGATAGVGRFSEPSPGGSTTKVQRLLGLLRQPSVDRKGLLAEIAARRTAEADLAAPGASSEVGAGVGAATSAAGMAGATFSPGLHAKPVRERWQQDQLGLDLLSLAQAAHGGQVDPAVAAHALSGHFPQSHEEFTHRLNNLWGAPSAPDSIPPPAAVDRDVQSGPAAKDAVPLRLRLRPAYCYSPDLDENVEKVDATTTMVSLRALWAQQAEQKAALEDAARARVDPNFCGSGPGVHRIVPHYEVVDVLCEEQAAWERRLQDMHDAAQAQDRALARAARDQQLLTAMVQQLGVEGGDTLSLDPQQEKQGWQTLMRLGEAGRARQQRV